MLEIGERYLVISGVYKKTLANQLFTVGFENNNLEFQIKNEEKNNFCAALLFEKDANR